MMWESAPCLPLGTVFCILHSISQHPTGLLSFFVSIVSLDLSTCHDHKIPRYDPYASNALHEQGAKLDASLR